MHVLCSEAPRRIAIEEELLTMMEGYNQFNVSDVARVAAIPMRATE